MRLQVSSPGGEGGGSLVGGNSETFYAHDLQLCFFFMSWPASPGYVFDHGKVLKLWPGRGTTGGSAHANGRLGRFETHKRCLRVLLPGQERHALERLRLEEQRTRRIHSCSCGMDCDAFIRLVRWELVLLSKSKI